MTSQGHPSAIFQRALRRRDLSTAWAEAHGLRAVSLDDALDLTLLVRAVWPMKFARAAARWVGRYATETDAPIAEVMLVASHLAALEGSTEPETVRPLAALLRVLGRNVLADVALRAAAVDDRP